MTKIDVYLANLKTYFNENNLAGYEELAEDLRQHLEASMETGQTEEEAIASLSPLEEIVRVFFVDRRSETAQYASGDVVAEEDIEEVFIEKKRHRLRKKCSKNG